jgi:acyl-CoA reductase-like NAD-dependent aldehyde dehydrogenase
VIIHESLYSKYLEDICAVVGSIRLGNPLTEQVDCGAITMKAQISIIQSLLDDAVKKGATCLTGGSQWIHPDFPKGNYFSPTVLINVTPEMRIFREEVFGPVLIVMKYSTDEEAIQLANGSGFGLGSGVFSNNLVKAESIGSRIKAGFTNINDFGVNYLCQGLPFGGVGISGVDCFAGVEGLRGNCYPKAVTKDKFGVKTKLPALLQYPIKESGNQFQKSLIVMLYGTSAMQRVKSVFSMVFGQ